MPIEVERLANQPVGLRRCPECGTRPFNPFMRGQVQSQWRKFFGRPYCCLICETCKEIVGYEEYTPGLYRIGSRRW